MGVRISWTPEYSDRWVIEEEDGSRWTIPHGGGDKKAFAGDSALLERLDVPPTAPASLQVVLVGVPEIADHAGVQNDTVRKWRQRHDDFPRPVAELAAGPVWSLAAVERWLRTHATAREEADVLGMRELRPGRRPGPSTTPPEWRPETSRLFSGEAEDYRLIAMPESGELVWPLYLEGYRMAAQLVLRRIVRTESDQDFFAYPLVFLYRQYLELQLKLIIHLGRELHGGRGAPIKTHSLTALWDVAIGHIRRVWPDDSQGTTAIRADLEEFDSLDRGSYAFRYPVGTTQEPSLPANLTRFNVKTFARRAEEIGEYLEGASEGMWVHRDWQRDLEREFVG
jgi:hypothetical protein